MDFDLNDEQKMLRESVQALLADNNTHLALTRRNDGEPGLDRDLWLALCAMGLPAILPGEEQGGLGMGLLTLAVAAELAGRYAVSAPLAEHALVVYAIASGGDDALRSRWLEPLLSGDKIATIAWGEAGGRWLPEQWTLEADDGRLGGTKTTVVYAAEADLILVGLAGGELAVVEMSAEGITVAALEPVDRTHPVATVTFADTPCRALTGGLILAKQLYNAGLVLQAADSFGAAAHALDMSVEYAKTREQFGRLIGEFQGLKFQLANMALDMEPCRALYWYAAHAWDAIPDDAERAAAIAKAHIADLAVKTARMAVECHGGIAITWEFALHIFLKRAMFNGVNLGLPGMHRGRSADLADW